jgi:raffinose/stachyose/melibiose transport system permease protein/N-acetylglucosamine transport system permease protein
MKDSNVGKFSHAMIQIVFILLTISLVFPFLWLVLNSFKTKVEFYKDIWAFPEVPQIQNYIKAWTEVGLSKYFLNSVVVTLLGTGASVLSAAMPAYVVAKFKFRGRNFVYNLAILGMVIPGICSFGSLYKLMIQTNLINSHLGLIIYYSGGLGMGFVILYGFFKSISWSYAEAAYIDGASDWYVFTKIMLPLARPGLAALALVNGINIWNDYFAPSMFLHNEELYTVSVGLQKMVVKQSYSADWTTLFAALIMAAIPILIIYVIFHEKIIDGFSTGGLKG